jgi:hypothetical protein
MRDNERGETVKARGEKRKEQHERSTGYDVGVNYRYLAHSVYEHLTLFTELLDTNCSHRA